MLNLVRAEIIKHFRLRLVLLIAISPAIITILVTGIIIFMKAIGVDFGRVPSVVGATFPNIGTGTFGLATNILIVSVSGIYLIGLVIVGAMAGSNEYGWHTIKMLATREPSRPRIVLSKTLFLLFMAVFMMVVLVLGWLLLGLVFKVVFDQAGETSGADGDAILKGLSHLFWSFVFNLVWAFLAMFLAIRFKSVVVAIIFYFVVNTLDGVVSTLGQAALSGQLGRSFPNWLEPLINLAKFISPFLVNFNLNQLTTNPNNPSFIRDVSPIQSVLVLLVWAGLYIWAAVAVFNRRDITE